MTGPEVGMLAIVFAAGILFAQAWHGIRHRRAVAARIRARYLAAVRVKQQYTDRLTTPFDAAVENGPEHTCSFGDNCARRQRDADRRATAERVR